MKRRKEMKNLGRSRGKGLGTPPQLENDCSDSPPVTYARDKKAPCWLCKSKGIECDCFVDIAPIMARSFEKAARESRPDFSEKNKKGLFTWIYELWDGAKRSVWSEPALNFPPGISSDVIPSPPLRSPGRKPEKRQRRILKRREGRRGGSEA
jgi:hypothetical protein